MSSKMKRSVQGSKNVVGISFDISGINEVTISERAFKKMVNLRFLRIYKSRHDGNDRLCIPEDMEFPRRVRLLKWEAYPNKCLPPTFNLENLVELFMPNSELEYLWQGTQPLKNLRKMDLYLSYHLKELPDLSNATNLEELYLSHCESLVEIPSSFSHLQKLKELHMMNCINLHVIPAQLNLASLETVDMKGCAKLRNFSFISTNFFRVDASYTEIEELPASISLCSRLMYLMIDKNGHHLMGITHLPTSLWSLERGDSDIERLPDCIRALNCLERLNISGCKRLTSLPELPTSLKSLYADDCESLETVFFSLNARVRFSNCFNLCEQARREIIQQSNKDDGCALLPGREVPAKFDHRGRGNSLTISTPDGNIPLSTLSRLKLCVVVSPHHQISDKYNRHQYLSCRLICKGEIYPVQVMVPLGNVCEYRSEHIYIFPIPTLGWDRIDLSGLSGEIVYEFGSENHVFDVVECGAYFLTNETIEGSCPSILDQVFEEDHGILTTGSYEFEAFEDDIHDRTTGVICELKEEENLKDEEHSECWS